MIRTIFIINRAKHITHTYRGLEIVVARNEMHTSDTCISGTLRETERERGKRRRRGAPTRREYTSR